MTTPFDITPNERESSELVKYLKYMFNVGGRDLATSISVFDEDWEPVGPLARGRLCELGFATEKGDKEIAMTDAGAEFLFEPIS